MFMRNVVGLVILSICCCHTLAQTLDHGYGYGAVEGISTTERLNAAMRCMNVHPQVSVDLKQMMGLWYGSEIIIHTQDYPGEYQYDSCVIIHLADVTEQIVNSHIFNNNNYSYNGYNNNRNTQQNNYGRAPTTPQYIDTDDYLRQQESHSRQQTKYLRLVWSERDNNLEYTFNYTTDAPGVWSNIGDQRGTLVSLNSYTQFTGTVQVVKAVNDHLVLTFCGNDVKSSIYTVVLSRNQMGLSADEQRSIRSMLSRRGLFTETIRKVCSGSSKLSGGLIALAVVLMLLLWGQRH